MHIKISTGCGLKGVRIHGTAYEGCVLPGTNLSNKEPGGCKHFSFSVALQTNSHATLQKHSSLTNHRLSTVTAYHKHTPGQLVGNLPKPSPPSASSTPYWMPDCALLHPTGTAQSTGYCDPTSTGGICIAQRPHPRHGRQKDWVPNLEQCVSCLPSSAPVKQRLRFEKEGGG